MILEIILRQIGLVRVSLLPLAMIVLSLSGVLSAFGSLGVALGGWAAGVGAGLTLRSNATAIPGASWSARIGLLHLPGSWRPLTVMLTLFTLKYVAGASLAIHPSLATDALFAGACSFGFGGCSGLLLARSLSLRKLATQSPARLAAGASLAQR